MLAAQALKISGRFHIHGQQPDRIQMAGTTDELQDAIAWCRIMVRRPSSPPSYQILDTALPALRQYVEVDRHGVIFCEREVA